MVTMVSLPCRSRRAKALWINDVEEFKLFSGWVWTCLESIVTVSWNHPAGFSLFASGQFLIEAYSPLLQMGIEDFLQRRFFCAKILAALLKGACLCRNRSKSWCSQSWYFGSGSICCIVRSSPVKKCWRGEDGTWNTWFPVAFGKSGCMFLDTVRTVFLVGPETASSRSNSGLTEKETNTYKNNNATLSVIHQDSALPIRETK